jgi:hypothetical protein
MTISDWLWKGSPIILNEDIQRHLKYTVTLLAFLCLN